MESDRVTHTIPHDVAFDRFLREKHARREKNYERFLRRVAVEDLDPNHFYAFTVNWMNRQLANPNENSTGGRRLPVLHFAVVDVSDEIRPNAHVLPAEPNAFIVIEAPMLSEMWRLSETFVTQNQGLVEIQLAPGARLTDVVTLFALMQVCFVSSHEYSHLARGHNDEESTLAAEIGPLLPVAQELEADGFGIYHDLEYFLRSGGRDLASLLLGKHAVDSAIVDCFILSVMLQISARWASQETIEYTAADLYPSPPLRLEFALLDIEMWCREAGKMETAWLKDGTTGRHFAAVQSVFPSVAKASWDRQVAWLKSRDGESYCEEIRRGYHRVRTGGKPKSPIQPPASAS